MVTIAKKFQNDEIARTSLYEERDKMAKEMGLQLRAPAQGPHSREPRKKSTTEEATQTKRKKGQSQ